jgi:type I restriction enzyme M protein
MGITIKSETETVIKKILPYLKRRGYDIEKDLNFETSTVLTDSYKKGYVDILVTCGKDKPFFLIEAKKSSKTLNDKDRDQGISYGQALKVFFVVITNGSDIRCFNVANKRPIFWNGKLSQKIPTRTQLQKVISAFKIDKEITNILDNSLPFRPGLPLKQLNALFARCHNNIRKIEKNEDNIFADFSKLLFLKLLEEKADSDETFSLPYSYRFHELAEKSDAESDQVSDAITKMISQIKSQTTYGEVLEDDLRLRKPQTFKYIVRELASVSFQDSSLDSKGAAFEYFVRATLKGKKLGQYFTPRPLIEFMSCLIGEEKIQNAIRSNNSIKLLDPACGTGGFLVYLLQENLNKLQESLSKSEFTKATYNDLVKKLKERVFYGSDANLGVASAAKMNMIIAGDGHTNIQAEDSLTRLAKNWKIQTPDCHIILTNPPFGTSESSSLSENDLSEYPISVSKGQLLFLQKMVLTTVAHGDICTVIDEGVLNTDSSKPIRRWLFEKCRIVAIVRLPEDTFKPNKINVRASVIYMVRREEDDVDYEDNYKITFCDLKSLGYIGSGDPIRNFDFDRLIAETKSKLLNKDLGNKREGYEWEAFDIDAQLILNNETCRMDYKYWLPDIRKKIENIKAAAGKTIAELNNIPTRRGKSPPSEEYVDETDGYALVIKAGTNISKYGELITQGDYIEKNLYDEMKKVQVHDGDILLSSTGDGTLGKCCVYRSQIPAIVDGHVTIIRVNQDNQDNQDSVIYPEYLCDYLRVGFGALQIERLYTGSTGLIELTPSHVDSIIVELPASIEEQKMLSENLRMKEQGYQETLENANQQINDTWRNFKRLNILDE